LRQAPELAERMIFVTGGAFTPAGRQFLDGVPNLRLEKPFTVQGLRDIVRRVMGRDLEGQRSQPGS
jgi:hypothetical protein